MLIEEIFQFKSCYFCKSTTSIVVSILSKLDAIFVSIILTLAQEDDIPILNPTYKALIGLAVKTPNP